MSYDIFQIIFCFSSRRPSDYLKPFYAYTFSDYHLLYDSPYILSYTRIQTYFPGTVNYETGINCYDLCSAKDIQGIELILLF